MNELGFRINLKMSHQAAIEKVTAALKTEGFGVLTSIDAQETMKQKLNVDFRPYTILGACNPPLAHQALTANPEIGLLLPCNVIVYQEGEGTVVQIIDPQSMTQFFHDPEIESVAAQARTRLLRVVETLRK